MKTATFPPLRVDQQLRQDTESVLCEGESLSQFVEQTIRTQVELRKANEAFLARGLPSRDRARQIGHYIDADAVLGKRHAKLEAAQTAQRPMSYTVRFTEEAEIDFLGLYNFLLEQDPHCMELAQRALARIVQAIE